MHVGIDSFVSQVTDPSTGHVVGAAERMAHLLEEIELADRTQEQRDARDRAAQGASGGSGV